VIGLDAEMERLADLRRYASSVLGIDEDDGGGGRPPGSMVSEDTSNGVQESEVRSTVQRQVSCDQGDLSRRRAGAGPTQSDDFTESPRFGRQLAAGRMQHTPPPYRHSSDGGGATGSRAISASHRGPASMAAASTKASRQSLSSESDRFAWKQAANVSGSVTPRSGVGSRSSKSDPLPARPWASASTPQLGIVGESDDNDAADLMEMARARIRQSPHGSDAGSAASRRKSAPAPGPAPMRQQRRTAFGGARKSNAADIDAKSLAEALREGRMVF